MKIDKLLLEKLIFEEIDIYLNEGPPQWTRRVKAWWSDESKTWAKVGVSINRLSRAVRRANYKGPVDAGKFQRFDNLITDTEASLKSYHKRAKKLLNSIKKGIDPTFGNLKSWPFKRKLVVKPGNKVEIAGKRWREEFDNIFEDLENMLVLREEMFKRIVKIVNKNIQRLANFPPPAGRDWAGRRVQVAHIELIDTELALNHFKKLREANEIQLKEIQRLKKTMKDGLEPKPGQHPMTTNDRMIATLEGFTTGKVRKLPMVGPAQKIKKPKKGGEGGKKKSKGDDEVEDGGGGKKGGKGDDPQAGFFKKAAKRLLGTVAIVGGIEATAAAALWWVKQSDWSAESKDRVKRVLERVARWGPWSLLMNVFGLLDAQEVLRKLQTKTTVKAAQKRLQEKGYFEDLKKPITEWNGFEANLAVRYWNILNSKNSDEWNNRQKEVKDLIQGTIKYAEEEGLKRSMIESNIRHTIERVHEIFNGFFEPQTKQQTKTSMLNFIQAQKKGAKIQELRKAMLYAYLVEKHKKKLGELLGQLNPSNMCTRKDEIASEVAQENKTLAFLIRDLCGGSTVDGLDPGQAGVRALGGLEPNLSIDPSGYRKDTFADEEKSKLLGEFIESWMNRIYHPENAVIMSKGMKSNNTLLKKELMVFVKIPEPTTRAGKAKEWVDKKTGEAGRAIEKLVDTK